jgi:hypothetical protein
LGEIRALRHAKGDMYNARSGSSVVVQQGWGQSVRPKKCGLVPPLFTEVLSRCILGSPHKSQQILSLLLYIVVRYLGYKNSTG